MTPADSAPVPPAQEGALGGSWYYQGTQAAAAQVAEDWHADLHGDEMRLDHGCVPSPQEAVDMGVTPPPGPLPDA